MAVAAQRGRYRVVAFNKCGHTSIINMFLTPPDQSVVRGAMPAVQVSSDVPVEQVYKGFAEDVDNWPEPAYTIAFFRQPARRMLSVYQHFIVRTMQKELTTAGYTAFTKLGFDASMTFPVFCRHLRSIDLDADLHLKPQVTSLNAAVGGELRTYTLENLVM